MRIKRRKTKEIRIGNVCIGGSHPITIQSMTKTKTADIEATINQIKELEACGCEIVRLAIKDNRDASALRKIKDRVNLPVVADIHFNWRLAIEAIDNGADKIRLNPGNIYKKKEVREIISALKLANLPLRIGVNSGSVRSLDAKRMNLSDKLVTSSLHYLRLIEKLKFYDIVISLKASNVLETLDAYRKMSRLCDYPFHLGVTATGLPFEGAIKSGIAIGALLLEGIGDTIRVSLTHKPQEEVKVAKYILQALGLRNFRHEIISCPTCGRCEVDLPGLVKEFERRFDAINHKGDSLNSKSKRIALMGCVVNGPGEARDSDVGVAFAKKHGLLFKKGRVIKKVSFAGCIDSLLKEMEQ